METRRGGLPERSSLQVLRQLPWRRTAPAGWTGVVWLLGLGLKQQARQRARALLAGRPHDLDLILRAAVLEITAGGDPAQAADWLTHSVALDPLDGRLRYWTARALMLAEGEEIEADRQRLGKALEHLEAGLALRPDLFELWEARGAVLASLGRWEGALAALDPALAARPGSGYLWAARGGCLRKLGRLEPALDSYQRAVRLGWTAAEVWIGLAQVRLELGDLQGSRAAAARARAAKPERPDLLADLGAVFDRLDDPAQAAACFEAALAKAPHSVPLRVDLAAALLRAGEEAAAAPHLEAAMAEAPDDPHLLNAIGILNLRRGETSGAIKSFQAAIKTQGESGPLVANLAACHLALGEYDRAATLYRLASIWEPEDARHLFGLGLALERSGNQAAALACYDKAVRLRPNARNHPEVSDATLRHPPERPASRAAL